MPVRQKFFNNGDVTITGIINESFSHFKIKDDGDIECSELRENQILGGTTGEKVRDNNHFYIEGEFREV